MDDSTIKMIEQALGVKVHGGAFGVTWIVLNWLGARVKRIPSIPNDFIPAVLMAFGCVVYLTTSWLLSNPFEKAQVLVGLAAGFVAVGSHQFLTRTKEALAPKNPPPSEPTP